MKPKLFLLFIVVFSLVTNAQTLNPTSNISSPGTANTFTGGYTFSYASSGTPWSGALMSFGGFSNQYDCQISSDYGPNGGNHLSFRTRNGDISQWNSWHELATRSENTFNGNQTINGNLFILNYNNKIVGFDDPNNYFIGTYPVVGSSGLNLHWYGGIKFGDYTGDVMNIWNGKVGIGTATPASKLDIRGTISAPEIAFRNSDGGDDSDPYRLRKVQGSSNNNWLELQLNDDPNESFRIYGNSCEGFGCADYSSNLYHSFDVQGNVFHKGNVGIGTAAPRAKLDVGSTLSNGELGTVFGRLPEGDTTGTGTYLGVKGHSTQGEGDIKSFSIVHDFYGQTNNSINFYRGGDVAGGFMTFNTSNNVEKMRITANGNVGIGTTAPSSKLHVNGAITLPLPGTTESSEEGISPAVNHRFNYDGKYLNHYGFGFYPFSKSVDAGGINTYMAGYYGLDFFTNDTNRIKILHNGNVGIGTITPDKKLTVKGTIHSSEVIVDTNFAPDYVFEKYYTGVSALKSDYHFPTLAEIENFTQKNNHLPGVPSAKEMQEKGISLGEMSTILLQKIEELTLYTIEQQKEIEELKTQLKLLLSSKK